MADLQSCYFCASPDDVGEYAVVPPRLGGGDRSVVLCPDCKTKLLGVMDPLIERAERGVDGADTGGSTAGSASQLSTPGDDGITMSSGDGSDPGTDDAETDTSAGTATGDPEIEADDAMEPASTSGNGTASTASSTPADDEPPQYRRAMRMLANREFPIPRTEVESMLANAYDLEREAIESVLAHAETEGRIVEENGQLREP